MMLKVKRNFEGVNSNIETCAHLNINEFVEDKNTDLYIFITAKNDE